VTKKKSTSAGTPKQGAFAYEGLDRVLHEKARLGILTALLNRPEGLRFTELKALCSLTDGNLSRHIQVLLDGGLIQVWKGKEEGRPQTLVRLSRPGRKQFVAYLGELERVIQDAKSRTAQNPKSKKGATLSTPPGWAPA